MLDHKSLCNGVGYLASFTIKYTEGSSDGGHTAYNLRKFNETYLVVKLF